MSSSGFTYTRLVNWLKIILPVTALGLLSTMFLISNSIDPGSSLTYARINLEELTGEQRISNPRFSSVTSDGASIQFSAESAVPDADLPNRFTARALVAHIETPDGAFVDITADSAKIDGDRNLVDLSGGVSLVTSTNYRITTDGMMTAMDATRVESRGPVEANGPMGTLTAGHAQITRQEGDAAPYLLVFKNRVKLVYDPQNKGEPR